MGCPSLKGDAAFAFLGQTNGFMNALDQLYDLEMDPGEQNNLAQHPMYQDIFESMKNKLLAKMRDMPRPFEVDKKDPYFDSVDHREKIDQARRASDLYELDFFRQGG